MWRARIAAPGQAVLWLAAFVAVVIALVTALLLFDLWHRTIDHGRGEVRALARILADQTARSFDAVDLVLKGVEDKLRDPTGRRLPLDSQEVYFLLSARTGGSPIISSLFVANDSGTVMNSTREYPVPHYAVGDRSYFRWASHDVSGATYLGDPVKNRADGTWSLHVARRLSNPDGSLRGVIVAALPLTYFENLYGTINLDDVGRISLFRSDGMLIVQAPHNEEAVGKASTEFSVPRLIDALRQHDVIGGDLSDTYGDRWLYALAVVPRFPLAVVTSVDEFEVLEPWRAVSRQTVVVAILVLLAIGMMSATIIREQRRELVLAERLRATERRLEGTFNSVMDAIVAVDEQQKIVIFNRAAERMFGYSATEAIGQPLTLLIPERFRAKHTENVASFEHSVVTSRAMSHRLELLGRRSDGTEFPIESTISRTKVEGETQMSAVLRDISERRQAQQALEESNRTLRELSSSLIEVREAERGRLSRELHDDLGQQLTGFKLDLSWLMSRIRDGRSIPQEKLADIQSHLSAAVASVRRISSELKPLILDDLGFGDGIRWLVNDFAQRSGIACELDMTQDLPVLNDNAATALFRIVQESLTNVARHAAASKINVGVWRIGDSLKIAVSDNGCGIASEKGRSGLGLVGMRERALSLGGDLRIESPPKGGTIIEATISINVAGAKQETS